MDDRLPLSQQTYVRLTIRSLWENLHLVLLGGLVFSLVCAPAFILLMLNQWAAAIVIGAVTVAPGWAGLMSQEDKILQDFKANPGEIFKALPRYGIRSALLGLLAAVPLLAGLYTLPMLAQPQLSPPVWLSLAADALGLLLLVILFLYAFPLLVLYDLDISTALRYSLILSSRYLTNTFGLLSMGGLFLFGILYFSSGLLFILPAVWAIFIVNNCRLVVTLEQETE